MVVALYWATSTSWHLSQSGGTTPSVLLPCTSTKNLPLPLFPAVLNSLSMLSSTYNWFFFLSALYQFQLQKLLLFLLVIQSGTAPFPSVQPLPLWSNRDSTNKYPYPPAILQFSLKSTFGIKKKYFINKILTLLDIYKNLIFFTTYKYVFLSHWYF